MPRKGKKKGKSKPKRPKRPKRRNLPAVSQVSPAKLQTMMDAAVAADEIIWLQRRVGHLTDERRRLRDRAAEREEQQEAVSATLNRRVDAAQAEMQARLQAFILVVIRDRLAVRRCGSKCVCTEVHPLCGERQRRGSRTTGAAGAAAAANLPRTKVCKHTDIPMFDSSFERD